MSEQPTLVANAAPRRYEQEARQRPVPADEEHELAAPTGAAEGHFASVVGVFQDDPMLDAMMANIRERRREMDADEGTE